MTLRFTLRFTPRFSLRFRLQNNKKLENRNCRVTHLAGEGSAKSLHIWCQFQLSLFAWFSDILLLRHEIKCPYSPSSSCEATGKEVSKRCFNRSRKTINSTFFGTLICFIRYQQLQSSFSPNAPLSRISRNLSSKGRSALTCFFILQNLILSKFVNDECTEENTKCSDDPPTKKRKVVEDYDSDEMDTEIDKEDDSVEFVDPSLFQPMTTMSIWVERRTTIRCLTVAIL